MIVGRWRIEVDIKPQRLDDITVAVGDVVRVKATTSKPWVRHDLVFHNDGERPVTFADTRTSEFLTGDDAHRLLAADEGCGYALNRPGGPAEAGACQANLDLITLEPGESARRSITLYKGLPGMDPLVAGGYVFRRLLRFAPGRGHPRAGEGRSKVISIVYRIEPASD